MVLPDPLPLFPLSLVLFPGAQLPLRIFEPRYLEMIGNSVPGESVFGVVSLLTGSEVRSPQSRETFCAVGTLAQVRSVEHPHPGLMMIESVGTQRFRILESRQQRNGLWTAQAELIEPDRALTVPEDLQGAAAALERLLAQMKERIRPGQPLPVAEPFELTDCAWVSNRWCELLALPTAQKQNLMALENPLLRLELVNDLLEKYGLLKEPEA